MPQFEPVDYGQAIQRGTQNALATMKAQRAGNELARERAIREAHAGGASEEEAANALRQQGYGQAANALTRKAEQRRSRRISSELEGMKFIAQSAPLARDQRSWQRVKAKWEDLGIADPGELPDEYDPELVADLAGEAENRLSKSDMVKVRGPDGRIRWLPADQAAGMAAPQDGGSASARNVELPSGKRVRGRERGGDLEVLGDDGQWRPAPPGAQMVGKGGSGEGGLKASDENAMHRYAASLYGGAIDPQTGEITGLNPEAARNVLAIGTRAAQLMTTGQVQTRQEAVSQAARSLGIDITDIEAREETQAATERVTGRSPGGQAPQPGPTRERAASETRVLRYDAEGNRIE